MIFWALLKTDLYLLKKSLKDKILNVAIWGSLTAIVSGYILQTFGLSKDFGAFQAGGIVIGVMGIELYGHMFELIADIHGNRHISYKLMLPIPSWLLFCQKATSFAINGFIIGLIVFPLIKIILWYRFDLAQMDVIKFFVALFFSSFFFGFFTIFITSMLKGIFEVGNAIMRILFPLWFFGGFQFSFQKIYELSPTLSYILLLNPYTYTTEAIRSAMLGPKDYLPFVFSIFGLIVFTIGLGYWGIQRMKAKIDFI